MISGDLIELISSYSAASGERLDALGTVDRFAQLAHTQSITNIKLLKVVDLNSYRPSTRTSAKATGARGRAGFQIAPKSRKRSALLHRKVVACGYSFDYSRGRPDVLISVTRFILFVQRSECNRRPPALIAGDRPIRRRRKPSFADRGCLGDFPVSLVLPNDKADVYLGIDLLPALIIYRKQLALSKRGEERFKTGRE